MTSHRSSTAWPISVALACLSLWAPRARAQCPPPELTLTQAAIDRGFTLTTFACGFPSGGLFGEGPLGIAFKPDGEVLVTGYLGGAIYLLPNDADGQIGPYNEISSYGIDGDAFALAQVQVNHQWKYYLTQSQSANQIIEINPTNGSNARTIAALSNALGIAPYPPQGDLIGLRGHLFVTDNAGGNIWDVNPQADPPTATPFLSVGVYAGGLAFSPDGSTIYVSIYGAGTQVVRSYDMETPATPVWESPAIPANPLGISIGLGALDGYIYVNCINGEVLELRPGTPQVNLIASGGIQGVWAAVDPNIYTGDGFPTLLLTQQDRIMRLNHPSGGFFGPPTSSTLNVAVSVDDRPVGRPVSLAIYGNPMTLGTAVRIAFSVPQSGHAVLRIYDVAGAVVATLLDKEMGTGTQLVSWDGLTARGDHARAGMYFLRLSANHSEAMGTLVVLR